MADEEEGYDTVDATGWTAGTSPTNQYYRQSSGTETKVIKSKGIDDVTSEAIEYNMNHRSRGVALIISNEEFGGNMGRRAGTDVDSNRMKETLQHLGFDVTIVKDVTSEMLQGTLMSHAAFDHSNRDCFLCVIMTHGSEDHIYGTNGNPVHLKTIISFFGGARCPSLRGKPKIFILNACQGEEVDAGHTVADALFAGTRGMEKESEEEDEEKEHFQNLPYELDFLYIYSTVHGYYSYRHTKQGSYFINTLCDVIDKYGGELEICKLLTLVNKKVAVGFQAKSKMVQYHDKKQCPCFLSLLTKQLYLTPRTKKI